MALGAVGREWRLMEGDAGALIEEGRGRSVSRNALVWTVGSCNFASLDGSGALDVKENEALTAEIWLFVVP